MVCSLWETRYPWVSYAPLLKTRQSERSRTQLKSDAKCQIDCKSALKNAESASRELCGGLPSQPSYSNNVVGSNARKKRRLQKATTSPRLRVAVDVDEGPVRYTKNEETLNKYVLEEYNLEFDICDYNQYDFASVWGCTLDEANHRVHDFFKSHHFAVGILPIPGAYHSLQRLRHTCDLVVVTSRQHIIQQPTLDWIAQHFPDTFAEVHFGNHWALSGNSRKKSEICRDIGATVIIDDNPRYAEDCAEAGMDVLLYDWQLSYPWAKTSDGPSHPCIHRVQDWNEVEKELSVLALQS